MSKMTEVYRGSSCGGMVNISFLVEDRTVTKMYDDGDMSPGRIVYFIREQTCKFWLHRESIDSQGLRSAGESQALEVTTKKEALCALIDKVVGPYKSRTTGYPVDSKALMRSLQEALLA